MDIEELRAKGNAAFAAGDMDAAHAHYSAALALDKRDARLLTNRSLVEHRRGRFHAAFSEAMAATDADAAWAKGWVRAALALEALGEAALARAVLVRGLAANPGNPDIAARIEALPLAQNRGFDQLQRLWTVTEYNSKANRDQKRTMKAILNLGFSTGLADLALYAMPEGDDEFLELEESGQDEIIPPVQFIIKELPRVLPTIVYLLGAYSDDQERLCRLLEILEHLFHQFKKRLLTKQCMPHVQSLAARLRKMLDETPYGRSNFGIMKKRQKLNADILSVLKDLGPSINGLSLPLLRRLFMQDAVDISMFGAFRDTCREFDLPLGSNRTDMELDARSTLVDEARRAEMLQILQHRNPNMFSEFGHVPKSDWPYSAKCSRYECSDFETASHLHSISCKKCEKVHFCSEECFRATMIANHHAICPGGAKPGDGEKRRQAVRNVMEQKHCGNCLAPEQQLMEKDSADEKEKEKEKFKKCSKCRVIKYCSAFCQEYHWKHGGHKNECEALVV
ncbi:hypothetical protein BDR26DRAFT_866933 [Obelidium mucronatum]|nr:hypothetical protein BDR26DRAFT_866933 [Obelidium mucronatum]